MGFFEIFCIYVTKPPNISKTRYCISGDDCHLFTEQSKTYRLNEVKLYDGCKTCVVRADSCLFSKHFVGTCDS